MIQRPIPSNKIEFSSPRHATIDGNHSIQFGETRFSSMGCNRRAATRRVETQVVPVVGVRDRVVGFLLGFDGPETRTIDR